MQHISRLFIAVAVSTLSVAVQMSPMAPVSKIALAASVICPTDGNHWYGKAISGSGSTDGTRLDTTTPSSWSVAQNSTSDEAAWIYSTNQSSSATETGYYSGYWPYSGGFTNSLVPYDTTGNGYYGWHWLTNPIPANTSLTLEAYGNTSNSIGDQFWGSTGSQAFSNPQTLPSPRTNMGQGEVTSSTASWMGGGSGETFTAYWGGSSAFYPWGSHNDCQNSPYWINSGGGNLYQNGGY